MEPTITCGKHLALHAKLTGSRFEDVCLGEAEFENVSLVRARLRDINMSDMDVSYFQMHGTKFHHGWAQQRPVSFEECELVGSTFRKCNLSGVEIAECNTSGMKIDGIAVADLLEAFRKSRQQPAG